MRCICWQCGRLFHPESTTAEHHNSFCSASCEEEYVEQLGGPFELPDDTDDESPLKGAYL
jgi:hypothetical protein